MLKLLTVAGSDSSGGAGIQADLKTFQELGCYGMSSLTVMVAMNPNGWTHSKFPIEPKAVQAQMFTALDGVGISAMKTGMLPTAEIITLVAETVKDRNVPFLVVDPVMVCKGANEPLYPENTDAYKQSLVPLATVVTPNLFEASQLSGIETIATEDDMKEAAKRIHALGAKAVIIKGGKGISTTEAIDILYDGIDFCVYRVPKFTDKYTHGAGCTFSAALTAGLAKGHSLRDSVTLAKSFVTAGIEHSFPLNNYVGPLDHSAWKRNSCGKH